MRHLQTRACVPKPPPRTWGRGRTEHNARVSETGEVECNGFQEEKRRVVYHNALPSKNNPSLTQHVPDRNAKLIFYPAHVPYSFHYRVERPESISSLRHPLRPDLHCRCSSSRTAFPQGIARPLDHPAPTSGPPHPHTSSTHTHKSCVRTGVYGRGDHGRRLDDRHLGARYDGPSGGCPPATRHGGGISSKPPPFQVVSPYSSLQMLRLAVSTSPAIRSSLGGFSHQ